MYSNETTVVMIKGSKISTFDVVINTTKSALCCTCLKHKSTAIIGSNTDLMKSMLARKYEQVIKRLSPALRINGSAAQQSDIAIPAHPTSSRAAVALPGARDPSLPTTGDPLQYVSIFVNDFISLAQELNLRRVRQTLLHTINHVFWPLSTEDAAFRNKPVSLKKLQKGDCS
jgi:hypothetical protein